MMGTDELSGRLRVGVIGCGQWGQNYLRVFSEMEQSALVAACDVRPQIRQQIAARYPGVRVMASAEELLGDASIQAVVVATEARSHFALASAALRGGKHVLCEKPLTLQVEEAIALARLADECQRTLMVGHIFRYNAGVNALREAVRAPDFGPICYRKRVAKSR